LTLKAKDDGSPSITHGERYKCCITKEDGTTVYTSPIFNHFKID